MYKHNFKILILLLLLVTNEAKTSTTYEPCDMPYKEYYCRSQTYRSSSKCLYKRKENLRKPSSNLLNANLLFWGIGLAAGIATAVIVIPQSK